MGLGSSGGLHCLFRFPLGCISLLLSEVFLALSRRYYFGLFDLKQPQVMALDAKGFLFGLDLPRSRANLV